MKKTVLYLSIVGVLMACGVIILVLPSKGRENSEPVLLIDEKTGQIVATHSNDPNHQYTMKRVWFYVTLCKECEDKGEARTHVVAGSPEATKYFQNPICPYCRKKVDRQWDRSYDKWDPEKWPGDMP